MKKKQHKITFHSNKLGLKNIVDCDKIGIINKVVFFLNYIMFYLFIWFWKPWVSKCRYLSGFVRKFGNFSHYSFTFHRGHVQQTAHLLCLSSARSAPCLNSRRCVSVFTCPDGIRGSFVFSCWASTEREGWWRDEIKGMELRFSKGCIQPTGCQMNRPAVHVYDGFKSTHLSALHWRTSLVLLSCTLQISFNTVDFCTKHYSPFI